MFLRGRAHSVRGLHVSLVCLHLVGSARLTLVSLLLRFAVLGVNGIVFSFGVRLCN